MPDLTNKNTPPNHQNEYITAMITQTASRSRLFHNLHPRYVLIYIDCFTIPTVSLSQPSAHLLI